MNQNRVFVEEGLTKALVAHVADCERCKRAAEASCEWCKDETNEKIIQHGCQFGRDVVALLRYKFY